MFNLGYIFGYVIEVGMGYGNWFYGEVVVIGMCMVVDLFYWLGWIDKLFLECIINLIVSVNLFVSLFKELSLEKYFELMLVDKKVK